MTIQVVKLHSDWPLSLLRTLVHWSFAPDTNYADMPAADYHVKVAEAQDRINARGLGAVIAWDLREEIAAYCNSRHVMLQSSLYLRASRPGNDNDVVGWHRESMYGASADSVNLWMPVMNVTPQNTLRYYPGTDVLSDEDIEIEEGGSQVERGSAGHKIGLLPEPKRIVGWLTDESDEYVPPPQSMPMDVPEGSAVLFPGQLIHGAAVNRSDKIRFSVDVRLLARGS